MIWLEEKKKCKDIVLCLTIFCLPITGTLVSSDIDLVSTISIELTAAIQMCRALVVLIFTAMETCGAIGKVTRVLFVYYFAWQRTDTSTQQQHHLQPRPYVFGCDVACPGRIVRSFDTNRIRRYIHNMEDVVRFAD